MSDNACPDPWAAPPDPEEPAAPCWDERPRAAAPGPMPAADLRAEAAVLGALLVDSRPAATLHLRATDFWAERHARIYAAILAAPAPADIVLVAAWLRDHGQLEAVGGLGYLTELLTHATVLSALPSHAAIVRAKSRTRQLAYSCQRIAAEASLYPLDLAAVRAELDALTAHDVTGHDMSSDAAPRLGAHLDASLLRVERRCAGAERPVRLPWPSLDAHFGGGLWPGLHLLNSGTGAGKTQWALQVSLRAARAGVPVLYVGLELGELDLDVRLLGAAARVAWSPLWTGQAGPEQVARAREALPELAALPFHSALSRPQGLGAGELRRLCESFRSQYPETDGPGSRPGVVVVDFLQIVGDDPGDDLDLRIRIGRAAYVLRDVANRLGLVCLGVSSIARDRYSLLLELLKTCQLSWDDVDGRPENRRVGNPDAAVGIGKETGELEYAADSVSLLAREPGTRVGRDVDCIFLTAKGRATGARWSPLHFDGFSFSEAEDGGGRLLASWDTATAAREARAAERKAASEARAAERKAHADADAARALAADVEAVRGYVRSTPGCSVRDARVAAVGDSSRRWDAAIAVLGADLVREYPTSQNRPVRLTLRGTAEL